MELPTLTEPWRLLWLLPLLPLLWWLAQPPRPVRVLWTAHRAQWLIAQASLRRRPPRFRALRWLLLSLSLVAVGLAHAGPRSRAAPGPSRLAVLLDGSASMGAADGRGGSVQGSALQALRRQLAAVPPHVEVALTILGDGRAERRSGAAARVGALPPPAGALPAPLRELAAAGAAPDTAVWTLTDGQHGDLPTIGALTCVGSRRANAAIVAIAIDDHWPLPQLELRVTLQAFGAGPMTGVLQATGAVEAAPPLAVELPAAGPLELTLALVRTAAGGLLELQLQVDGDALAADDRAGIALAPLPAPRIAVLADGDGGPFVRAAAKALAAEIRGEVVDGAPGAAAGFLLVEGGQTALQPGAAPWIGFGVKGNAADAEVWAEPVLTDWDRREPLLAGIDCSELVVVHALRRSLPDGQPLLWGAVPGAPDEPLAVLVETPQAASLHFAFRLQDSNLALLPAFPQLLRRAFLRGHRHVGAVAQGALLPASESDLLACGGGADRPLPDFGRPGEDLSPLCLLAALLLLAVRSCLR